MDPANLFGNFYLENYAHEGSGDGGSSQMTLDFGRPKQTRKRKKKKELEHTFEVPIHPQNFIVPPSLSTPSSMSSTHAQQTQSSALSPLTPLHKSLPPIPYLNLDGPFTSPDQHQRSCDHQSSLGLYVESPFLTPSATLPTSKHLSWSPETPSLISSLDYDPFSSPETTLSTPPSSSSHSGWKVLGPNDFDGDKYVRPHVHHCRRDQTTIKEDRLSQTRAALKALDGVGISLFEVVETVLDPQHSEIFPNQRNAFFRHDTVIIPRILSFIFDNQIGHESFLNWLPINFIRDQFCHRISCQMEAAKPFFHMNTQTFSIDFLEKYDLRRNVASYAENHLSDWMYALKAATGSLESQQKDTETELVGTHSLNLFISHYNSIGSSYFDLPSNELSLVAVLTAPISTGNVCLVDWNICTDNTGTRCRWSFCLTSNNIQNR